jgi:replicative DNA helicase
MAIIAGTKHAKNIGVFSLEMTSVQWALRLVSGIARLDSRNLRSGEVQEAEWPAFYDAVGQLSESNIFVDDSTQLTPAELRAKCRRLDNRFGLDMIMVDYLQLMHTTQQYRNRVHQVSYICKSLKDLGKEINCPVVVSSQLSRAVEQRQDKRPQLSDLRDSGTIEEDADIVIFIYRDDYYNPGEESERPNIAEVNVAKNRNGNTGIVDLFWNRQYTRFYNLERKNIVF